MTTFRHLVRSFGFLFSLCLFLFPLDSPIHAGEPTGSLAGFGRSRSWADQSGQFKIEGTLKYADDQKVELLKKDGRVVTVPFARLSRPDQNFVRAFLQAEAALGADAAQDEPDNPFAGGVPSQPASRRNVPRPTASGRSSPTRNVPARNLPGSSAASGRGGRSPENESLSDADAIRVVNAVVKGARPLTITPTRAFWSAKPHGPSPRFVWRMPSSHRTSPNLSLRRCGSRRRAVRGRSC